MTGSDEDLPAARSSAQSLLAVPASLLTIVLTLVLLEIGQDVLLPILLAVIAAYILIETERFLTGLPLLRHFPKILLRLVILGCFLSILAAFGIAIEGAIRQMADAAPRYQQNIAAMLTGIAAQLGTDGETLWQGIATRVREAIDLQAILGATLSSAGSFFMLLVLVAIYASFLMAERHNLSEKLLRIFKTPEDAARANEIVRKINEEIGGYLATKTLINVVIGAASYVVLLVFGVDFALLLALLIGLTGYIPYVGSYIGIAFPVLLSLAQFGSIGTTLLLFAVLSVIQFWEGNMLEPRLIGKRSNLSPFVVLFALAAWSALWGLPGAIFAVPLTSMIVIVCGAFPQTRWVPILLSHDVSRLELAADGRSADASRD